MAAAGDQGLQAVQTFDVLDRTSTPVRLPTRNDTPNRTSSNPRAAGGSAMRKRMLLAADKPDSDHVDKASGRSLSRRKQRRWENKNLMGSEHLSQILAAEEEMEMEMRKKGSASEHIFLRIEWRSAFHELFEAKNRDALETFRQCAEHFTAQSSSQHKVFASQSEEAWSRVGRRLRSAVLGFLGESPATLFPFLGALEDQLVHFANHKELKSVAADDEVLSSYLQSPLVVDGGGVLHVFLRDFKGNRFLLHAVSQFYGLQSKSYKKKGPASAGKVTAVTAPRSPSSAASRRLSITNYLLVDHFNSGHGLCGGGADSGAAATDSGSEVEDLGDKLQALL